MGEGRSGSVYHFEWRLRASPLALWPFVSDTQRLNEAIGLPEWRFTDKPGQGTIVRDGEMRYLGVPIRWDEKPFEWVEGKELGVERLYANGPLRRLKSRVRLSPDGERGTHLQHSLEFEARGFI